MLKPRFSITVRVRSSPLYTMVPASASTMPRMMFSRVVLPQPEGPRMETISPSLYLDGNILEDRNPVERLLNMAEF